MGCGVGWEPQTVCEQRARLPGAAAGCSQPRAGASSCPTGSDPLPHTERCEGCRGGCPVSAGVPQPGRELAASTIPPSALPGVQSAAGHPAAQGRAEIWLGPRVPPPGRPLSPRHGLLPGKHREQTRQQGASARASPTRACLGISTAGQEGRTEKRSSFAPLRHLQKGSICCINSIHF